MPTQFEKIPESERLADDLLRGAQAIADELGWRLRPTFHALGKGYLPARKAGAVWVASRRALRRHFENNDKAA